MTNITRVLTLFIAICVSSITTGAQDVHLSHIHASPTFLNPSMAGLFDGQLRLTANMRSQWNEVTNGYKTMVASADLKLTPLSRTDYLSAGIQVMADRAGDLNFTNSSAGLSLAYLKGFDNQGRIMFSFGAQVKYVNSSIDFSQINSIQALQSMSIVPNSNTNYLDFNAGISSFYRPSHKEMYYAGIAIHHLNNPNLSFYDSSERLGDILYRRMNIHGGADIQMSKNIVIKPSVLYMLQGPNSEFTFGSFVKFQTKKRNRSALHSFYVGAWFRTNLKKQNNTFDALVTSLRFDYRNMQINFSYDVNISSYFKASNGLGSMELSFVQLLNWQTSTKRSFKIRCPEL